MLSSRQRGIKSFFAKNREISAKREAYWKKQQLLAEQPETIEMPSQDKIQSEFKHCDELLKRDWFLDPEDIEDLLNSVPQDICHEVYELINQNYETYSYRIREVIAIGEPLPYRGRMKVGDLTDRHLFEIEREQNELKRIARDQAWETYKEMFYDERPHNQADEKLKKIQASIDEEKKKLEAAKKKPKKYVAPNARNSQPIDPEVKIIQESIEMLENELKNANKLIIQLNADWEYNQRRIFEKDFFKVSLL
jgi:hypothetical protein